MHPWVQAQSEESVVFKLGVRISVVLQTDRNRLKSSRVSEIQTERNQSATELRSLEPSMQDNLEMFVVSGRKTLLWF